MIKVRIKGAKEWISLGEYYSYPSLKNKDEEAEFYLDNDNQEQLRFTRYLLDSIEFSPKLTEIEIKIHVHHVCVFGCYYVIGVAKSITLENKATCTINLHNPKGIDDRPNLFDDSNYKKFKQE